jgi:hypothetical protein
LSYSYLDCLKIRNPTFLDEIHFTINYHAAAP